MSTIGDQTDKHAAGVASPDGSSSSQEQGGGVRLDARFEALKIEPLDDNQGANTVVHNHAPSGMHQGYRGNNTQNPAQFQVGNIPSDGDVFSTGGATNVAPGVYPGNYPVYPSQPGAPGDYPIGATPGSGSGARDRPVDAQAYYPADACVFVANLPEGVKDSRLEVEVTRAFSDFGTVFVKIRRDHKNMPFAFCQFTKADEAQTAKVQGKGIMIDGRPCRTEMVKANRSFVIYNAQGFDIGIEEARYQLNHYGEMAKCELLHPHILEALKLPSGVLVEFNRFDPGRDVVSAFRNNAQYRVMPYDLKKALKSQKPDSDEEWLKRYDIDRRSIFIGNLPMTMDNVDDVIRGIMSDIGDVDSCNVVRKEARPGSGRVNVFCFVTFTRPDMADLAIQRMDGITVGGCRIRVERKTSRNGPQGQPRRMQSRVALSEASPARMMGTRGSADVNHDPATPLRHVGSMTVAPAAEMYAGHASTVGDIPVNYRGGYAGYGACEPLYTGNFPATPQGTPGMASPYHATYGSGGNAAPMGSNQYYWAPPYVQEQALAVPTAYYHPDSNQSPVASSAQQTQVPLSTSVQRATGQAGTPTKSASHDPRSKSDIVEDEGTKSA